MPPTDDRRALVDLLPQYLMRRRRGWSLPADLQPALPMGEFVVLRADDGDRSGREFKR